MLPSTNRRAVGRPALPSPAGCRRGGLVRRSDRASGKIRPVLALCAIVIAFGGSPGAPDVVVTAAPPVDVERLADALRTYLVDYGIRVDTASVGAAPEGDLRRQLGEVRRTGEAVRAVAVVRAETRSPGSIEIELVDLATEKTLLTTVPRAARDEDLYRALALKIQALLRSTLSEEPGRLAAGSGLARWAEPPRVAAPAPVVETASLGLSLETGYAGVSFPLGGLTLQGVGVAASLAVQPWLELGLGGAALGSVRSMAREVVVDAAVVPLMAVARFHRSFSRYDLLAGPLLEVAIASVATTSGGTAGHASRDLVFAMGGEVEGRLRVGSAVWLYLRPSALGIISGPYYVVEGRTVADTSRLQLGLAAGIGVGMH